MSNTVILHTFDDRFAMRLSRSLSDGGRLICVRPSRTDGALWDPGHGERSLTILDWRARIERRVRADVEQFVLRDARSDGPLVVVRGADDSPFVEIVGYRSAIPQVVLVPDTLHTGLHIRTLLNNGEYGAYASVALSLVLSVLPRSVDDIVEVTIADGRVDSSVKECSARLARDRGTIRRHLRRSGQPAAPREILDLIRATYAAVLIHSAMYPTTVACGLVGAASKVALRQLIDRAFGVPIDSLEECFAAGSAHSAARWIATHWKRTPLAVTNDGDSL